MFEIQVVLNEEAEQLVIRAKEIDGKKYCNKAKILLWRKACCNPAMPVFDGHSISLLIGIDQPLQRVTNRVCILFTSKFTLAPATCVAHFFKITWLTIILVSF